MVVDYKNTKVDELAREKRFQEFFRKMGFYKSEKNLEENFFASWLEILFFPDTPMVVDYKNTKIDKLAREKRF